MVTRPPVTDWTSDWDYLDPSWINNPYPIWQDLREHCPVAHTDRYGGVYLVTRYNDIRDVAYDPARFSSRRVVPREGGAQVDTPPLTYDPPEHRPMRMILVPPFTPQAVAKFEPQTRVLCNELIDRFIAQGRCDGVIDYAQNIPVGVITRMLGIPAEDGDQFRAWIDKTMEGGEDPEGMKRAAEEMFVYFAKEISKRREQATDDLISFLIQARLPNGELLSDREIVSTLRLLLVAGIDTTGSSISASILHLASHPADRERLVREPELIPTAIEEFLRAYAPVTVAREITKDTEIHGCPMRKGEMVLLPLPSANRDPEKFPDADRVLIDRKENPHVAFGLGIHRCLGSNLARMEMRIAIDELLKRIPNFRLDPARPVLWSNGTVPVRAPRLLPLVFDR